MSDYLWDPTCEPEPGIAEVERALRSYRHRAAPLPLRPAARPRRRVLQLAIPALAAAALLLFAAGWAAWRLSGPDPWTVEALQGAPRVHASDGRRLAAGARVETDAESSARLAIGRIGVADLAGGSLVEVLRADPGEHRLALRHGTLHANIWAPPRFFVVETPSATATDLGCIYSLTVDAHGGGVLAVAFGEVELESGGLRTLVAAGMEARLHPRRGPGLPRPLGCSEAFRRAVAALDEDPGADEDALEIVLREADPQATATLWHLLPRLDSQRRARVVDRLDELSPRPQGVSRAAVLALEPAALARWQEQVRPLWSSEPSSWWRRLLVRVGLSKPAVRLSVRPEPPAGTRR